MTAVVDIQKEIDQQKLSGYQWLIFVICLLVVAADGFDTGVIGYIAPSLADTWGIERASLGPVISAALMGMVFGALSAGPMADRLGRKLVVILSVLFLGVWTVASAYAQSLGQLEAFRFLTGLGLGAAMPNIATLLSEYMPSRIRATMVNTMFCAFPGGIAIGGLLSGYLIPAFGWQSVLLLGGIFPLLLCVVMLFWLPESLHFMVVKGKEPAKIAHILAKVTGRPTPEQATFVLPEKQNIGNQKSALGLIFSKPFRMTTLSLWVACFTSLLVFYLLTSWFTTLLQNIGFSQAQSLQLAPMFPLGGAVGAIVIGWLMDKYHATHTVMYSYLVAAILLVLTGMNHQHTVAFAVLIFLTGAMVGGAQSALPALTASFYPVKGRATGVSWMHGIGRFGAIFGAMIGGELLRLQLDMISIFLLLAIPALITTSALFVLNVVNKRSQRQAALVSEA